MAWDMMCYLFRRVRYDWEELSKHLSAVLVNWCPCFALSSCGCYWPGTTESQEGLCSPLLAQGGLPGGEWCGGESQRWQNYWDFFPPWEANQETNLFQFGNCILLNKCSGSWGGGECQLGNNKINVEYFGWSGMKQEVPKVCPRVSLQQWQRVALQALVLNVGKGLGAGVQCWSEGRFLVWCREGWFASPVQTAVLQHTCRLYAGSL